jgi:hypothetical protein
MIERRHVGIRYSADRREVGPSRIRNAGSGSGGIVNFDIWPGQAGDLREKMCALAAAEVAAKKHAKGALCEEALRRSKAKGVDTVWNYHDRPRVVHVSSY